MRRNYIIALCVLFSIIYTGNSVAQMAEIIKKNESVGGGYYSVTDPLKDKKKQEIKAETLTLIKPQAGKIDSERQIDKKGHFVSVTPMNDCFKKAKKLSINGRYNIAYQKCLQKKVVVTPVDENEVEIQESKKKLKEEIKKGDDDAFYTDIFKGFKRVSGRNSGSVND